MPVLNSNGVPTTVFKGDLAVDRQEGNGPESVVTMVTTSEGGIGKVVSNGETLKVLRPTSVSFQPQGKAATAGTSNVTRHISEILPFRFSAVTATIFNAHSTATPTYNVGIATSDSIADPLLNSETWDQFLWSGSNSVTPPVATGATVGNQIMGESVESDVLILDPKSYGDGTVLGLRSWADLTNNTWFDFDAEGAINSSLDVQGYYVGYKSGVNGVTSPSSFTSPTRTSASQPPVRLKFYTQDMVKTHGLFSSSTGGGKGDTADMGWPIRTSRILTSTGPMAYHFCNYSHGGAPSYGNLLRFLEMIDNINVDTATFNVFTVNDTDRATVAGLNRLLYQQDRFIDECRKRGIWPILQTWQHPTGSTGNEYVNAKICNSKAREKAAIGICGIFDVAELFSDETAAVGTWKNPANTTDGIHPNSTGQVPLTDLAVKVYA